MKIPDKSHPKERKAYFSSLGKKGAIAMHNSPNENLPFKTVPGLAKRANKVSNEVQHGKKTDAA